MTALPNSHVITTPELIVELIATPFRAVGDLFIRMAERHPRAKAVEALNAITDEELAARGLTRAQAVQQVLGTYY